MLRSVLLLFALVANLRTTVVENAMSRIGTPYRFGSASERAVDCSGLVQLSYATAGIALPRTSSLQFDATERIERDDIAPGDLVFFADPRRKRIHHVGIVVDADHFVHAERGGVAVERFSHPYYARRLVGFGRPSVGWRL